MEQELERTGGEARRARGGGEAAAEAALEL